MNSVLYITTEKKEDDSVPIVIAKRYYKATGENKEHFNFMGIFYPIEVLYRWAKNFLNGWINSFTVKYGRTLEETKSEVKVLNTETGNFEIYHPTVAFDAIGEPYYKTLPDNISILIEEKIIEPK